MEDVQIYLERVIDRHGDYGEYDPMTPIASPAFYAHIVNDGSGSIPCEAELRVTVTDDGDGYPKREAIVITPRQLDEDGDLIFGLDTLNEAIARIKLAIASTRATGHANVPIGGGQDAEAAQAAESTD